MIGLKDSFQVILVIFLFVVSVSSLFAETYPATNSKANVCILAYDTEFKKNLTAALAQNFNAKEISVTVDSISNGGQYNPADYGSVILLSGVRQFHPLPKAVEYILTNNYAGNIIYVSTQSLPIFNSPYGMVLNSKKIDAITSASLTDDDKAFDEVKNKIIEKTIKVLSK